MRTGPALHLINYTVSAMSGSFSASSLASPWETCQQHSCMTTHCLLQLPMMSAGNTYQLSKPGREKNHGLTRMFTQLRIQHTQLDIRDSVMKNKDSRGYKDSVHCLHQEAGRELLTPVKCRPPWWREDILHHGAPLTL